MTKRFVGGAGSIEIAGPRRLVIEELAGRWCCSVSGIRKKIRDGRIPPDAYFQVGGRGRLLFREEAIERLEREST